jgi:hypothetical protein
LIHYFLPALITTDAKSPAETKFSEPILQDLKRNSTIFARSHPKSYTHYSGDGGKKTQLQRYKIKGASSPFAR